MIKQREREKEIGREREREDNTLLHRDKDLSTSRLFCKSVRASERERQKTDRQTGERETDRDRHREIKKSFVSLMNRC